MGLLKKLEKNQETNIDLQKENEKLKAKVNEDIKLKNQLSEQKQLLEENISEKNKLENKKNDFTEQITIKNQEIEKFSQEISKLNEDKLKWQKNIKDYTENISKYIDELNDLLLNLSKDNIDVSMMENMIEKYNSLISTLNIEDLMSNDSNNNLEKNINNLEEQELISIDILDDITMMIKKTSTEIS